MELNDADNEIISNHNLHRSSIMSLPRTILSLSSLSLSLSLARYSRQRSRVTKIAKMTSAVNMSVLSRRQRPVLRNSIDTNGEEESVPFPEGGRAAWLVVLGSFCGLCAGVGLINSVGVFQVYLSTHQLADYSAEAIGWIFGVYGFLMYACGIVVGPLFDFYDARWLIGAGGLGIILTLFLTAVCEEYWQFMLVLGVLNGVSSSCLFCPCFAVIGHWFNVRRGFATGVAALGGCIGGIMYPLVLEKLLPELGWAGSVRVIGYILTFLCAIACLLVHKRLPVPINTSAKFDFTMFKDSISVVTIAGLFMVECAVSVPLTYISSYAIFEGFSPRLATQLLVTINASSIVGRLVPGFFSDKIGRFNTIILVTTSMTLTVLGIWLPFGHSESGVLAFAILFGLGSGSSINLIPVCIGQLCGTKNYGRYYATANTVFSVGLLLGLPVAGSLLKACDGAYWGLIIFVGLCYFVGTVFLVVARCMAVGTYVRAIF